jgi:hypothetical protein
VSEDTTQLRQLSKVSMAALDINLYGVKILHIHQVYLFGNFLKYLHNPYWVWCANINDR